MWAAEPWMQRRPGKYNCWDVKRDMHTVPQDAREYFKDTYRGTYCGTNWYEGNKGLLGQMDKWPEYSDDAPALLGFDETIDAHCSSRPKSNENANKYADAWDHAKNCVASNLNILSLYGDRVPYNICRNLEWMSCGAQGKLPGQRSSTIVFSKAPRELDPSPTSGKPFGECRGFREQKAIQSDPHCSRGYATDDIYFLEVCLFNFMCENGDDLFRLNAGQPWTCRMSSTRFHRLRDLLLEEPSWHPPRGLPPRCAKWCNQWNCEAAECNGCYEAGKATGWPAKCKPGEVH